MIFQEFPKIARYSRQCTVTEKIDGTNAQVFIELADAVPGLEDPSFPFLRIGDSIIAAGSRTRWISPQQDNHAFARFVYANAEEMVAKLGPGHHFGEWWGSGIQRGYGLLNGDKRFSLFNSYRFHHPDSRPSVCGVVPVLYEGPMNDTAILATLDALRITGSVAAPGFMNPEGIVVYHQAAKMYFKKTIKNDESPKGIVEAVNG